MKKTTMKKSVALKYEVGDKAPKIVALGKGVAAEKIIDKAIESGVPIHNNEELVNNLTKFNIGDEIPPELYEVVAEILLFIDKIDKFGDKK